MQFVLEPFMKLTFQQSWAETERDVLDFSVILGDMEVAWLKRHQEAAHY